MNPNMSIYMVLEPSFVLGIKQTSLASKEDSHVHITIRSQKSKSTDLGSKSTNTWSGSVPGFRVGSRIRQQIRWRHPMTCRWRGLGHAWLLMWHADVEWWRHLMTSNDINKSLSVRGRHVKACTNTWWRDRYLGSVCWRVWRRMITRFSGQVDWGTTRLSWQRMWLRSELRVKNLRQHVWEFQELLSRVLAHAASIRGRVLGFWSRYAVEHVCLVGFIRQRLNVHRSDRERHRLLGCWILT